MKLTEYAGRYFLVPKDRRIEYTERMESILTPLSEGEFKLFQKMVYERAGIHLKDSKISLVANRLRNRLRALNLATYRAYYDLVLKDRDELVKCIDAITTNETYFFREPKQWEYLQSDLLPILLARNKASRALRIWSAASSTGEEPYTIAIFLREHIPDFSSWNVTIVASDINAQVLQKAKAGVYKHYAISRMEPAMVKRFFTIEGQTEEKVAKGSLNNDNLYHLKPEIRGMVQFKQHNLLQRYPLMKFYVVFCRNVLIYFDQESKTKVLTNIYDVLQPEGYLFLGAAEGMMGIHLPFETLKPSIYRKLKEEKP